MLKKSAFLTRPTPARRDALFPMRRSGLESILNGDPAASPTRRRAQTWCSLFVAPCAPEGTPPVLPSAAALLIGIFEHPALSYFCHFSRAGH